MTDIKMSSEMTVKLIRHSAADDHVVQAAQVSNKGENNPNTVVPRLIEALMRDRHGSPFEHTSMTFFVEVPLFVVREWQRHRISSFNEMSGRYTTLQPKFYTPPVTRGLENVGTSMRPQMGPGNRNQRATMAALDRAAAQQGWEAYQARLATGIANELARTILPLSIYTQMYWTVNARSLMNFLSLRVESDESLVKSYPQWEIAKAAEKVEEIFFELMPHTYGAFVKNGRVAP